MTFSRESSLQESLQIFITLTEDPSLIFLQSGVEKLLACGRGFEPTTLDLTSQSGAYDLSAMATHSVTPVQVCIP